MDDEVRSEAEANEYTVVWEPQAGPQTALLACPCDDIFFGGARGGGKTDGALGEFASHADEYAQAANGLMVRRSRTELRETIERSQKIYSPLGAKYNSTEKVWRFTNGARMTFAYLDRDSDAENYQGDSRTRVYVEEIGNFPDPKPVDKLKATLRSPSGVPCKFIATGNPGGPGHGWIKERYIDLAPLGWVPQTVSFTNPFNGETLTKTRVYIPSRLTDNRFLDPAQYIPNLQQSGSEQLVRAWLLGDFSAVAGAYFDEFSIERHVVAPFTIPAHWVRFRAFDWGSARPFVCGWFAVSDGTVSGIPKGALVMYREWYGGASANVGLKLTASAVADGIRQREAEGEKISYSVADPAIFTEDGGPSIGEEMSKRGIRFRPADNKRIPGWSQVRGRLSGEENKAMLVLFSTCANSIRTFPLLQHDEKNPEDINTEGDDHCADMIRYGCMSRPWLKIAPKVEPMKNMHDLTLNELYEKERQRKQRRR